MQSEFKHFNTIATYYSSTLHLYVVYVYTTSIYSHIDGGRLLSKDTSYGIDRYADLFSLVAANGAEWAMGGMQFIVTKL